MVLFIMVTTFKYIGTKKQVVQSSIQKKVLKTILKKAVMAKRAEVKTTIVDNQHIGKEAPRASN